MGRFAEPSTWAGIAAALSLVAQVVGGPWAGVVGAVGGVAAALAVKMREGGHD